jgi:hypothetical protein
MAQFSSDRSITLLKGDGTTEIYRQNEDGEWEQTGHTAAGKEWNGVARRKEKNMSITINKRKPTLEDRLDAILKSSTASQQEAAVLAYSKVEAARTGQRQDVVEALPIARQMARRWSTRTRRASSTAT